jgi:hypothetical protein
LVALRTLVIELSFHLASFLKYLAKFQVALVLELGKVLAERGHQVELPTLEGQNNGSTTPDMLVADFFVDTAKDILL